MVRRAVGVALTLVILAAGIAYIAYAWDYWLASSTFGTDYRVMVAWAGRWLTTGQPYFDYQLAGPYTTAAHPGADGPIMYPPTVLLLVTPFLWLPAVLWWAIPITVTAWAVWRLRPRPLVWPFLALLVAFPMTSWFVVTGNPVMWFVAACAAGAAGGPWAVTVLLKPTLAPFALIGVWRRDWWLGLGLVALASVGFLPLWVDYATVARNAADGMGLLYNVNQYPMMMIPVIAWLGRSQAALPARVPAVARRADARA